MKKIFLFLICLLFSSIVARAQVDLQILNSKRICNSAEINNEYFDKNPEDLRERILLSEKSRFADLKKDLSISTITIPIVFHVNDSINPQKVTLAQIQSAVDILNADFNGFNPEFYSLRPEFQSIAADVSIRFCLASIDPNGLPSSGVTYHYNDYNGREPDGYGSLVKLVSVWPCDKYLNVWIVNKVEDDNDLYWSGWAFYPSTALADQGIDGIVYNHRYLGYDEGSSEISGPNSWQANMARVLTHEVGHYLNLMHTFNNNCNAPDDEVSDTPPVAVSNNGDCEQTGPFCAGVTVINDENFMDYSDCPSMFTEGQRTRMFVALNSNVGYRNNLWSTANLFDVGCQSTISINENHANLKFDKKLIKTVGILGKESKIAKNKLLFYIYNDGTVEKKVILE